ncbi:hypothetical protein Bca4012_045853 [Brassica carinata]
MVNKMIKGGFVPDIQTFNTLVGAITKSGEVGFCIEMYYTTCKIDGHKPFPSFYAPKIKGGVCRNGKFDEAFSFISDMKVKAHPLNMPVYTTLITMCCCGGRFMDAASYSVEMTEMGFGSYITVL